MFALIFTGQFYAAQTLFRELQAAGLFEYQYREIAAELALASGDLPTALAHETWTRTTFSSLVSPPVEDIAVRRASIFAALGDIENQTIWVRRFLQMTENSDSPLTAAVAAYLGMRLLSQKAPAVIPSDVNELTNHALRSAEGSCRPLGQALGTRPISPSRRHTQRDSKDTPRSTDGQKA